MSKYIFVTGGVISGLGKGIAAASIGRLLESRGYRIAIQKFDPYLNVDPGTMSPFQHGEVYVTDDGAEMVDRRSTVSEEGGGGREIGSVRAARSFRTDRCSERNNHPCAQF